MGPLHLKRFTKRDIFDRIAAERRSAFLRWFAPYLHSRGVALDQEPLDVECLLEVLATPTNDTPHDLIEALYVIDEMATPTGMDAIVAEFGPGIVAATAEGPPTPADVAVHAWLEDRERLARCHARQLTLRKRALQTHRLSEAHANAAVRDLDDAALAEIESRLQRGFVDLERGGHVRVRRLATGSLEHFSISHGGAVVRAGAIEGGESTVVHYRPLEHDLVIFDQQRREISLKRQPPRERDLYLRAFGDALVGNEDAFQIQPVLTLEPIREDRRGCLYCADIRGLREVILTSVQMVMHPTRGWRRTEKAKDLFLALEEAHLSLPNHAPIQAATFECRFEGSNKTRSVGIAEDGVIKYTRDGDHEVIDRWLRQRRFVRGRAAAVVCDRSFWSWLGQPSQWTAQRLEWEERLGESYEKLSAFFRPAAEIHVIPRAGRRALQVVADGDGGRCAVDPDTHLWSDLDEDEAETLTLNIDLLSAAIAPLMTLETGQSRSVPGIRQCWWMGEYTPFEGERFPVYLIASADAEQVESAVGQLVARSGDPFIIVTPTRECGGPTLGQMLAARRLAWVSLEETLELVGAGAFEVCLPLEEQLDRFLRVNCPRRFGEEPKPQFPTPPGSTWDKVHMRFRGGHHLEITIDPVVQKVSFEEMNLGNQRTKKPNRLWELLLQCARDDGFVVMAEGKRKQACYRQKADLVTALRDYFGIYGDPFESAVGGWQAVFSVKPDE